MYIQRHTSIHILIEFSKHISSNTRGYCKQVEKIQFRKSRPIVQYPLDHTLSYRARSGFYTNNLMIARFFDPPFISEIQLLPARSAVLPYNAQ